MKYLECLEYIDNITKTGKIELGLDSIRKLCERLGNPQKDLKFVHIAGTNGKGSTLCYISQILLESGYKVGRYISPTIRDYRERIQINNKMISMKALCEYMAMAKEACEKMAEQGEKMPTAFEIETALAFKYFADKKCDVVVLECGLGGLYDATNIVDTTVLSVLASISMDHMQFLGESLEEIAGNKAGIIKKGVPVVTTSQEPESLAQIEQKASECSSQLYFADSSLIKNAKIKKYSQTFEYEGTKYETGLLGVWQKDNAVLAIKACEILKTEGYSKITAQSIQKGIYNAVWQGRFQIVCKKPLLIIDGAHNEDAAYKLKNTIDTYYPQKNKIMILGMFADKEVEKVASLLTKEAVAVFTCATPGSSRALPAVDLAQIVRQTNPNVTNCDSVEEAVEFATSVADENSVIIATGSLAYLGKILDMYD